MNSLKKIQDVVGKTITKIQTDWHTRNIVIWFNDGSVICIYVAFGYDNDIEFEVTDVNGFDDYDLRKFGFITDEEYNKREKAGEEQRMKELEHQERNMLAKLKEKYENK